MEGIIGSSIEVTLQHPPGAVLLGTVSGVDPQTSRLMLHDGELYLCEQVDVRLLRRVECAESSVNPFRHVFQLLTCE